MTEKLQDMENEAMSKIVELEKQLMQRNKDLESIRVRLLPFTFILKLSFKINTDRKAKVIHPHLLQYMYNKLIFVPINHICVPNGSSMMISNVLQSKCSWSFSNTGSLQRHQHAGPLAAADVEGEGRGHPAAE